MSIFRFLPRHVKNAFFLFNQRRIYGFGYSTYRQLALEQSVNARDFDCQHLPPDFGKWLDERIVEYPWLVSRLPSREGRLLDAGSVLNFDFLLSLPILQAKKIFISTLAPETTNSWQRGISYVYEDLRHSCFRDGFFDWVVSLSTLEHIGLDNTKLYTQDTAKKENSPATFLNAVYEFRRVLKDGGVLYLSVPFGQRKNLGWLQVFDEVMVDDILEAFAPASYTERHFRYTDAGWKQSSREASRNAVYFDCHSGDLRKGSVAAAEAVVCMELVK